MAGISGGVNSVFMATQALGAQQSVTHHLIEAMCVWWVSILPHPNSYTLELLSLS